MSKYSAGRETEWEVRDHLLEHGYNDLRFRIVVRSAGSKGEADLVAMSRSGDVLVSVKKHRNFRLKDVASLMKLCEDIGAIAVLAYKGKPEGSRSEVIYLEDAATYFNARKHKLRESIRL